MNIKKELQKITFYSQCLEDEKSNLEEWKDIVRKYEEVCVNEATLQKLIKYRNGLIDDSNSYIDKINSLYKAVMKLEYKQRVVIINLYFQGKSLQDATVAVDSTLEQVLELHNQAIIELEKLYVESGDILKHEL